jgi:pimeloyl-ACP methyl ester carboxylesterase
MCWQWPAPGHLVSIGEHRLHLHCKGQGGPTLVLEAGMAGWSQDWAFVHDGLAQAGQVCSYDWAGYGWSDAAATPRNGMDAVDDLRRALDVAGKLQNLIPDTQQNGCILSGSVLCQQATRRLLLSQEVAYE